MSVHKYNFKFIEEIAKPVEPVNGQFRPTLLKDNQGGKALKWLSRPFRF